MSLAKVARAKQVEELRRELANITKTMNVPDYRQVDVRWLRKKMAARNSEHPKFGEAEKIVEELASMGAV